jgi:hypothetical protein
LICILWYQTTVQNLKSVLKLYLETIGGGQRDGRTHTHQTKRRVSHNTSPLTCSVEGYTKPSAELEINVDVNMSEKTNERTDKGESWHGLGEMGKR